MNISRIMALIALLLVGSTVASDKIPRQFVWDYSTAALTPEYWGGVAISASDTIKDPDGKSTLKAVPEHDSDDQDWPAHLWYSLRTEAAAGAKEVEISFWMKGEKGAAVSLRLTSSRGAHYTSTQTVAVSGEWQKIIFREPISAPVGGKWLSAPRLIFSKCKAGQPFFIGPVTFKSID